MITITVFVITATIIIAVANHFPLICAPRRRTLLKQRRIEMLKVVLYLIARDRRKDSYG